jgi:hypothetical protein
VILGIRHKFGCRGAAVTCHSSGRRCIQNCHYLGGAFLITHLLRDEWIVFVAGQSGAVSILRWIPFGEELEASPDLQLAMAEHILASYLGAVRSFLHPLPDHRRVRNGKAFLRDGIFT